MNPERYARFSWLVVATNLAVILWGAYVRATGSGAGCGNHWPLCNGEIIPPDPGVKTLIEYSHRLSSGIALLMVLALLVWAFRLYPRGHRVRHGAVATMIIMLVEAGLGAGIVLFELVADNATMARALFMATHLGNTFLLVAAMTITAYWAGGGEPIDFGLRAPRRSLHPLAWATLAATTLVGMSGAVAALGDTLFPATSLQHALEQDLSPTSHILIQLRVFHPLLALGASALIFYLVAAVRKLKRPQTKKWATLLNVLVLVQLTAGGVNMILLAPVAMQMLHLLLADILWITLVLTCATALPAEEGASSAAPATRNV